MRKIYLTLLALLVSGSWAIGQINTFPQFEDFEAEPQGPTGCGPTYSTASTIWDNGDDANPADPTHQLDWTSDVGGTGSSGTGPSIDHTLMNSSGHYMYTEASCSGTGYSNRTASLISTWLDFSNMSTPRLNFWYHMYGQSMGLMHVDVDSTGQGDWDLDIVTPWTDNVDLWQETDMAIPIYQTNMDSIRIRIRMVTGTNFYSDAAVDDILIYEPQPYDLQASDVLSPLSGCGLGIEDVTYEYFSNGSDSLFPGDTVWMSYQLDTNAVVTEAYVLMDTLLPGGTYTYTFMTQADMSNFGNYDLWVYHNYLQDSTWANDTIMVTITNIPVYAVMNFFEDDFESGFGWTGTGDWAWGTPAKTVINGAASGSNAWVSGGLTGTYSANTNDYVESPCFDLSNMCDPWVSADVWWNSEFSWDGANLWYSTDGGGTWSLVGGNGDPYNWYTDNTINASPGPAPGNQQGWTGRNSTSNGSGTWVESHHSLPGLAGNSGVIFRMYFGTDGSVQDDGFAFDNFRLYDGVWLGRDMFLCKGDTAMLDARGSSGASFLWSTGDTTQILQVVTSGWYSVDVTADTNCTNSDSIYVYIQDSTSQIFDNDTLALCGVSVDVCPNYLPLSTVFTSTGDTLMMDAFGPGLGCINVDSTQMITAFAVTPCDTIWDTVYVQILGEPTVDLGNDSTQCGGSIDLDAGSQSMYMWSTGDTTQMISAGASGTYGVTVYDANGCDNSDEVMVTINAVPTVDLGADMAGCMGDTICLMPVSVDSNATYDWSNGASGSMNCVTAGGDYVVTITDVNGCSSTDTVNVALGVAPGAAFTSTVGAGGLDWTFTDGSTVPTSWAWDFGDGATSTMQNPTHTYTASGTYTVCLTVTNACGTDQSCETLTVVSIDELTGVTVSIFPNPNNGTFSVEFDGIEGNDVELSVMNLYGQTVYSENLPTVSGKIRKDLQLNVSQGVYFVRIATQRGHVVRRITVE